MNRNPNVSITNENKLNRLELVGHIRQTDIFSKEKCELSDHRVSQTNNQHFINECKQFEERGEEFKISHDINTESVGPEPKIEKNTFQFFQKIDLFQNI